MIGIIISENVDNYGRPLRSCSYESFAVLGKFCKKSAKAVKLSVLRQIWNVSDIPITCSRGINMMIYVEHYWILDFFLKKKKKNIVWVALTPAHKHDTFSKKDEGLGNFGSVLRFDQKWVTKVTYRDETALQKVAEPIFWTPRKLAFYVLLIVLVSYIYFSPRKMFSL